MMWRVTVLFFFVSFVIQLHMMPDLSIFGFVLPVQWMMIVVIYLALFDRPSEEWDDRLLFVMGLGIWADSISVAPFGYHLFILAITYFIIRHGIATMMVQSGRSKWLWVAVSVGLYDVIDAFGHWMIMHEPARTRFIFAHMWMSIVVTTALSIVILPLLQKLCGVRGLSFTKQRRVVTK